MPKNIVSHTLSYSFHAVRRCLERGITERNVTETVRFGVCISDRGDRAVYARGRMRVVLGCGGLVVTAFRQRRRNPKRSIRKARKARQAEEFIRAYMTYE